MTEPRAPYIGRFAPSPTGPLHFGSLVTALGSFLQARKLGGRWLVRIEDIDQPRVIPGAADQILRSLAAHGLHPDGAVLFQRQRIAAYDEALRLLNRRRLLYACTCSRKTLRETARIGSLGPTYPGTCRDRDHPIRPDTALRVITDHREWGFHDGVQGWISQRLAQDVGDFILRRADGLIAYQLAVVVDDHDQGVTEIVRGADLLDSTPRQLFLQYHLGLATPRYVHLPVALDPLGHKLSKQTAAPPLQDHQAPAQLCAALKHLGHPPFAGAERACVTAILNWAIAHWDPRRIPTTRALTATALGLDRRAPVTNQCGQYGTLHER